MLCFNSYCLEMKIICTYNRLHSNVDECEQRNFFKLDSRLLEFLNQFVTEEKWGEMSQHSMFKRNNFEDNQSSTSAHLQLLYTPLC